jgi:hypothetical protein
MKTGGESERWEMSRGKRTKREQTQNWGQIEQYSLWRFYAEAGLAKKPVIVHLSTNALRVEYEHTDLALYTVIWHEDYKHITEVANPHVIQTSYRSPQLTRLPAWT